MKPFNIFKRYGARVVLLGSTGLLTLAPAFAQTAPEQPDVAAAAAYMLAGIVTLGIIGNAKLIVRGAMAVFRWVAGMIK